MTVHSRAGSVLHHLQQDDGIVLRYLVVSGRTSLLLGKKAGEGSAVNEVGVHGIGALAVELVKDTMVSSGDRQRHSCAG